MKGKYPRSTVIKKVSEAKKSVVEAQKRLKFWKNKLKELEKEEKNG